MKGNCLCGDVSWSTEAEPQGISMCHCGQCRRQSGGVWSSAFVASADLKIEGPVAWYEVSATAKRGFCPNCGSFLFWTAHDEDTTSFSLGSVDGPTGLRLEKHIFTSDKGDYYDIAPDAPQS